MYKLLHSLHRTRTVFSDLVPFITKVRQLAHPPVGPRTDRAPARPSVRPVAHPSVRLPVCSLARTSPVQPYELTRGRTDYGNA